MKNSKNFRITQIHGSLAAKDILNKRQELDNEEHQKIEAARQKKELKERLA